jgi:predicted DNA-binding transcriptional regulator AlpA
MMDDQTLTINQFCAAENISRTTLYRLWRENRGPRWLLIGSSRRISAEARARWRREREEEAETASKVA